MVNCKVRKNTRGHVPCVRARMPVCGLIGIRMVVLGIRLQTWMRVILDVDVTR
jgi:hypothetical protein